MPGRSPSDAASCYNGMFGVFKGLNIKGVAFHQGFNNAMMNTSCKPKFYRTLMKLMVELVQNSSQGNIQDIQNQAEAREQTLILRIDRAFLEASRDPSKINILADLLRQNGLWEQYEDRFFALVRSAER